MAEWSRRKLLTLTAVAGSGTIAGCTDIFVGGPRPKLIEMDQQLPEAGKRVEVSVTVENRGAAGDVLVTIRALDGEGDPVKSVEETHAMDKDESLDLTIPIDTPTGTARFAALVEPA
jgi:hypothetical protein